MRAAITKEVLESELTGRFAGAFKIHPKSLTETLPTGLPEIDALTNGLPRGAVTEIFGPASSGRTTLMLASLAYATAHDEICALVDVNDVFDPASATAAGVDLKRLLWIRCSGHLEPGFKATDMILQAGGFGLLLLDLGNVSGQEARRIISSWWYRFRRTVENTPTVFVVVAAESCVRSCATLALEMKRESEVWSSSNSALTNVFDRGIFPSGNGFPNTVNPSTGIPPHSILLNNFQRLVTRRKPMLLAESQTRLAANHLF